MNGTSPTVGPANQHALNRADWLSLAAIATVFAMGWVLVAGWQNVPVLDDWIYAWSVEHLLNTGRLAIQNNSSSYPVTQVLWAALFAWPAGFSFGALRLSTVVLATLGCWAIYLTLRELAVTGSVALLAALSVALYPAFFVLTYSFMTDVPFVSLSAIALFFSISGVRRDRPGRLWLGALFTVLAFLVRQLGALLPLAAFAAVEPRLWRREVIGRFWLPLTSALVAVGLLWFTIPAVFGHHELVDDTVAKLRWLLYMKVSGYLSWNLEILWVVAFAFAPLLLCQLTRWRRAFTIAGVTLALLVGLRAAAIAIPPPLHEQATWSPQSLALSANLIGGTLTPAAWAIRAAPLLKLAGAIAVAAFLVAIPSLGQFDWRASRILVASGLLYLIMINVAWLYFDRYYLPFVPLLAFWAAAPLRDHRFRLWPAVVLLGVWAFVSVTGTRYVLAMNGAASRMTHDLEAQGVPPSDINAGYALNGWRLYTHPENLAPHQELNDVPFVSSERATPYRIVTTPEPGDDIVRTEHLPAAWWQATDRIYLIHRQEPAQ